MRFALSSVFLIAFIALSGCRKEENAIEADIIELPVQGIVRDVVWKDDSLVIVGGTDEGFVLTCDWRFDGMRVVTNELPEPVYSTAYFGRWYFGSDSAKLWLSDDLKSVYWYWWKEDDWIGTLSQRPIRDMAHIGDQFFITTGGGLAHGAILQTGDTAASWEEAEFAHEFRCIDVTPTQQGWIALAGGNGTLKRSTASSSDWTEVDIDHVFITDVVFLHEADAIALTYQGDIFRSEDGGLKWERIHRGGMVDRAQDMAFDKEVGAIAAGNGRFAFTKDFGKQWTWYELQDNVDLHHVTIVGQDLYFARAAGGFYRVSFDQLQ